ncbi:MAG: aminotransferase class V-fold PLP-dependent enzyme [Rhodothermales bacterium]
MTELEAWFAPFRENTIGMDATFDSPYGTQRVVYADWIASGRLYRPIEQRLSEIMGPWVGNTHTETSITGTSMTLAYHEARAIIKRHVNAGPGDVIIASGSGMTGVINKMLRILGLRVPEKVQDCLSIPVERRPVVFLTHMEHHSNQTTWLESLADVVVLDPDHDGRCATQHLRREIVKYADRPLIGSFTACSNVTGVRTPYHELARIMHEHGGLAFVDFAANAPYEPMDMHPEDPMESLDAIFFSPHKFLGGPGSPGIVVFDARLDSNRVPDHPGGGTVNWTNPWGEHTFISDIEDREDGGTPPFLQTIKAALAIRLKEAMDPEKIMMREHELLEMAFPRMRAIPGLHLLADAIEDRLGVLSFYVDNVHYNLIVKLLNDRFGVQVRGGCSCAGTYGHFLLHVDKSTSHAITERIDRGDMSLKPGWVRLSLHPTMTNEELEHVLSALEAVVRNVDEWKQDYRYDPSTNEFTHVTAVDGTHARVCSWFDMEPAPATAF